MVTQQSNQVSDPMDTAMDTEYVPRARVYFGQVEIDTFFCALVRGMGKVPFDPGQHSADRRCTAIHIAILPLPESKITNPVERDLIAESKEWGQIIKPSLRTLNVDLRGVNGKWAQVELVSTGRTYQNKAGEEKQATTFKFLSIFDTEAECIEANAIYFSAGQDDGAAAVAASTAAAAAPSNGNGNGNGAARATAAKFLQAFWLQSGKDVTKFAEIIAKTSPLKDHFTIDSPEVLAIIGA